MIPKVSRALCSSIIKKKTVLFWLLMIRMDASNTDISLYSVINDVLANKSKSTFLYIFLFLFQKQMIHH